MLMLTKENLDNFKKIGRQENVKDPLIIVKYFYPAGAATWYCTEYDETERVFFGFCDLYGDPTCAEWGYVSLDELEAFRGRFELKIERDRYFKVQRVSECDEIQKRMGRR